MVTLSPMSVAIVCHVGDPLQLMCTGSVQFVRWRIFQVNEQGILEEATDSVLIGSSDANQMKQKVVHSVIFTFMRISTQRAIPLISTLSIDSVNTALNRTVVRCTDVANPTSSATTTIKIMDNGSSKFENYHIIITNNRCMRMK